MKLFEIMNGPADDWQWTRKTPTEWIASVPSVGVRVVFAKMPDSDTTSWTIMFDRTIGGSAETGVTGWGNSITVFLAVGSILLDFLRKETPDRLSFTSADTESRATLYARLVQRWAARSGYDSFYTDPHSTATGYGGYFELTKPDNDGDVSI